MIGENLSVEERRIMYRLLEGLATNVAATFTKHEEKAIHRLITWGGSGKEGLLLGSAFVFGTLGTSQNLGEHDPLTADGKRLYNAQRLPHWPSV